MSTPALVSVVTPTWNRHELLTARCIPSVAAQTYPNVEHIVVSDGPDQELYDLLCRLRPVGVRYVALDRHDPGARWGHWARRAGLALARGRFLAYLDDDNAYRPGHLADTIGALDDNPAAGFAYSRMLMHFAGNQVEIGTDPPAYGQIDTSVLVHRAELLDVANWQPSLPSIDWDLVYRWIRAGATWAFVPHVTVDYYK